MNTVEISIANPRLAESVVKPTVSNTVVAAIANISNVMDSYKEKLAHEEPFANCTSDMIAHL